jgi:hypothetical protein
MKNLLCSRGFLPKIKRSLTWLRNPNRIKGDAGMTTAEYAMGIIAAVAFAGLLLKVLTSSQVQQALSAIISKALSS